MFIHFRLFPFLKTTNLMHFYFSEYSGNINKFCKSSLNVSRHLFGSSLMDDMYGSDETSSMCIKSLLVFNLLFFLV